jgi:hypothetical protein
MNDGVRVERGNPPFLEPSAHHGLSASDAAGEADPQHHAELEERGMWR